MQEFDFKIQNLTKDQRCAISRRFWNLIGGQLAQLIPLPVLLWSGLSKGILWAIPVYLLAVVVCSGISWSLLPNARPPWRKRAMIFGVPFGAASLVSLSPIWFQLELTVSIALMLGFTALKFMRGDRDAFTFLSLPPEVGAVRSGRLAISFVIGTVLIAAINAYLALEATANVWLFFRTFAALSLVLAMTAVTMRVVVSQARQTPDA
jgi:intracellular septation protein A